MHIVNIIYIYIRLYLCMFVSWFMMYVIVWCYSIIISHTALDIRVAWTFKIFQGLVRRRLAPKPSHSERWDVCIPWAKTWDTSWLPSQWKVQTQQWSVMWHRRRTKWMATSTTFMVDVDFNFIQFHSISMWPYWSCWDTRLESTLHWRAMLSQSNVLGVKRRNFSAPVASYFCKTAFTSASSPSFNGLVYGKFYWFTAHFWW